uniref:Serpin peptidase inhibitor, clade A (alpha-1 antiproteinase, antitrypsin), member 10a n=1 Tax=Paramormyrops kingsleyae TaxID=1676925 RepID=A0A3B3RZZ7_9TELE|nr:protein Z-dependent protease inhibitor-like [Paramormyrops kingsleyae]XP_023656936.1 protein Z-dependent protease inhibitor-like [Paramormyrops kingsleyae]
MMKTELLCLLVCSVALVSFGQAQETSQDILELVARNTEFATNLYRKIASTSDNNIVFSPLSISASLATMLWGSQGVTRDQILAGLSLATLRQSNQPERIPELFQGLQENLSQNGALQPDRATAFFVQQQLEVEKAFSDQAKKFFGADINKVDFSNVQASTTTINDYIRSRTGGNVKSVAENIDPKTQLMLISSIFFQAKWELPFNSSFTQEERFFVNKYKTVQVPMMFRVDRYYLAYDGSLKVGILKLPLQAKVAMLILLPDKDVDYTSIDEELTNERFLGWIKQLKKIKLEVQLPRIRLEESYAMSKVLPDLGFDNVFDNRAELTGFSKAAELKVSEVLHKAVIKADEEGTSVTASPATSVSEFSMLPRLTMNRPFLFLVYHEVTNSILFMGRVIDPTKS